MRPLLLAIAVICCFNASPVLAQSHGHSHTPLIEKSAIDTAELVVLDMIKKNVVEDSWRVADVIKAERRVRETGPEWVVTFKNSKIADSEKQTLYVFLDNFGHFLAANYTGK